MGIDFGKAVMSIPVVGGVAAVATGKTPDSYLRDAAEGILGDGAVADAGSNQNLLNRLNPFKG